MSATSGLEHVSRLCMKSYGKVCAMAAGGMYNESKPNVSTVQ